MPTRSRTAVLLVATAALLGSLPSASGQASSAPVSAVWGTSTTAEVQSNSWLDATAYTPNLTGDICNQINQALAALNSGSNFNGSGTIDARGVPTPATCAKSPWDALASPPFSTVLLPAGTITISVPWILPNNTRVIGLGSSQTILKAASGYTASDMIEMGQGSSAWCPGISVNNCQDIDIEHLQLNGGGTVGGITNDFGEEQSRVNDVVMVNMGGTGLTLSESGTGLSTNSGAYTNISFTGTGTNAVCLNINSTFSDTRGVHGLTCKGSSGSAVGIYVDGSNNTLEDVHLSGFTKGILVGSRLPSQSNVLLNISGDSTITTLIDISNATSTSASIGCPQATSSTPIDNVCDLTIMGATAGANTTIKDELTNTTLTSTNDAAVALYILGERVFSSNSSGVLTSIGFSRFTTSTSFPSWISGGSAPTDTSCAPGSLYSCTGTSTSCTPVASPTALTLYGCTTSSGTANWVAIQ
jgi:hypothetical protein